MHKSSPNVLKTPDNPCQEDVLAEITNIMPSYAPDSLFQQKQFFSPEPKQITVLEQTPPAYAFIPVKNQMFNG
jgi:hypothetical protein